MCVNFCLNLHEISCSMLYSAHVTKTVHSIWQVTCRLSVYWREIGPVRGRMCNITKPTSCRDNIPCAVRYPSKKCLCEFLLQYNISLVSSWKWFTLFAFRWQCSIFLQTCFLHPINMAWIFLFHICVRNMRWLQKIIWNVSGYTLGA